MVVGELVQERDLIVIGGGPAGYTAAIRAAQLGREVTLIEQKHLGGTCLHSGCIPSKTLAHAAAQKAKLRTLGEMGISAGDALFDLSSFQSYTSRVIARLEKGIESLCAANEIEIVHGQAAFLDEYRIGVENGHQFETFRGRQIIIATGASPLQQAGGQSLTSYTLFQPERIPERLVLAGLNYITIEAAFAYQSLGCEVTIAEGKGAESEMDEEVARELKRVMKKRKIAFFPDCSNIAWTEGTCRITDRNGKEHHIADCEFFREEHWKGNTGSLSLERVGIRMNELGFIEVDGFCRTSLEHVFAAGDVTGGPLLAVIGIKQGKAAAEIASGEKTEVDMMWMPAVIHSDPPIAFAGFTEEKAKEAGFELRIGKYPLQSNGFAMLSSRQEGFVKLIFDVETDRLLGAHMIGEGAVEFSSTFALGLEMGARDEDLSFPHYPHPSLNEALLEAVEGSRGRAIHQPPEKKKRREKV